MSCCSSRRKDTALKLVIAGAPASGKGTQCELIKEKYGVYHISTGDMLRENVKAGTDLGKKAKGFMDEGLLVPDDVIIGMVKAELEKKEASKGWLLDGFPRTRAQADAMKEAGIKPDLFIYLDVSDDVLVERVVGRRMDPDTGKIYHLKFNPPPEEVKDRLIHRSDDTKEKVQVRIEQFHKNIESIKDAFSDCMLKVNGEADKHDIFKQINAKL